MKIFGVIPARGGSKGIPRKNLCPLLGRPLIEYTIKAAQQSELLDDFWVSTEDEEIAEVSIALGAKVLKRPVFLAEDDTPSLPVLVHFINNIGISGDDAVCHLLPTYPLRDGALIDRVIESFQDKDPDSVKVVKRVKQHPFKMYTFGFYLTPYEDTPFRRGVGPDYPRQRLTPLLVGAAACDVIKASVIIGGSTEGERMLPYIISGETGIDIDQLTDIHAAEYLLEVGDYAIPAYR